MARSLRSALALLLVTLACRQTPESTPLPSRNNLLLVTIEPAFVEARLNLGIAWQETGNRARAAEQYEAVVAAKGAHARERDAARTLLAQLEQR